LAAEAITIAERFDQRGRGIHAARVH
jgi:hypothetical protein